MNADQLQNHGAQCMCDRNKRNKQINKQKEAKIMWRDADEKAFEQGRFGNEQT